MVGYTYNQWYARALLHSGRALRAFEWSSAERADFIAMYRMGGEL